MKKLLIIAAIGAVAYLAIKGKFKDAISKGKELLSNISKKQNA